MGDISYNKSYWVYKAKKKKRPIRTASLQRREGGMCRGINAKEKPAARECFFFYFYAKIHILYTKNKTRPMYMCMIKKKQRTAKEKIVWVGICMNGWAMIQEGHCVRYSVGGGAYRRFRSRRCYRKLCSKIVEFYLSTFIHIIIHICERIQTVTMLPKNAQSVHNKIIIKVMMTETDNVRNTRELHRMRQDVAKQKKKKTAKQCNFHLCIWMQFEFFQCCWTSRGLSH